MKKIKVLVIIIAMVLVNIQVSIGASNSVGSSVKTIKVNGQNKAVNVVTVDLNNKDITIGVNIANNKIGGHEDFSNMIKRKKPIAAINANYFDAYKTLEPMGTIMIDGKFQYLEGSPASMVISNDGKVSIGQYKFGINGYINGFRENKWNNGTQAMDFNLFQIWYVNNLPKDSNGVYLYTPSRGDKIALKGGIAIEVVKDKVTKITKNAQETIIPKDGYIIYYGNCKSFETYVGQRFKVGNTIELEYEVIEAKQEKQIKKQEASDKEKEKTVKAELSCTQTKLFGSINGQTANYWSDEKNGMVFNLFNIWYINSKPIHPDGVYLYTPERGSKVDVDGGHYISVEDGKIAKVEYNTKQIKIPKNGFAIYYAKNAVKEDYIKARFEVGFTVDFYHEATLKLDTNSIIKKAVKDNEIALQEVLESKEEGKEKVELRKNNIKSIISAGPYLIEDGKIVFDQNNSAFKEDKITKNRAQRSAVGITKNNKLILVTGSNLNMAELSKVMVELGAVNAMNLDGGASSALYSSGKTITQAGRKLNTVLMIYEK